MPISTDMLEAFVAVAAQRSVSAAAVALGVSKSVVSKRIAQLEQRVGSTLLARSSRRVALTPAGETYLDYARSALQAMGEADERLRDLRTELSGRIRITAPVSWGQQVLAPRLHEFLQRHPAIEIDLLLGDRMMDLVAERIDLALRMTRVGGPELRATPVAPLQWVVCAAPAYLQRAGTPHAPAELAAHVGMCYWRESADDAWQLVRGEQRETVLVRSRFHANNPEAVAGAALAGLGLALLPRYMCEADLAAGRLQQLLPQWTPVTQFGSWINAVAAPERLRLSRNRALLEFLKERLG